MRSAGGRGTKLSPTSLTGSHCWGAAEEEHGDAGCVLGRRKRVEALRLPPPAEGKLIACAKPQNHC